MNSSQNTPQNSQITQRHISKPDNNPDEPQERAPKFSIESLRNNLQEISQETREVTQELPRQVDTKAIAEFDKKQRIWLFFYWSWLFSNISNLGKLFNPTEIELTLAESLPKFAANGSIDSDNLIYFAIALILATSIPCIILSIAWLQSNLKLRNIGLKATLVSIVIKFWVIFWAWFPILSRWKGQTGNSRFKLEVEEMVVVMETGLFLMYCFFTYGGGRKFRSYLIERERILKDKME